MTCKVAFIGLGVMGYPMAGYISKAGHDVTVYNRTKAKACLLYTSPSPRDRTRSRMPSSA